MSEDSMEIVIIGAGPSGIAMGHTIKHKLGFNDFIIYDKLDGPGGTWLTNTYPGCGCDVPAHLYSFSFNLNPDWSEELAGQPEILRCKNVTGNGIAIDDSTLILPDINNTVDKFALREHMVFGVECKGARWTGQSWEIDFYDVKTGISSTRRAAVLISAVGGISYPRDIKFPGMEKFQGAMFHSARWDHSFDYRKKRVAVIGNGCSAAQIVPAVAKDAATVKQYARSPQWYHERPNHMFTPFDKFCFRYIPLWQRLRRLRIFLENDNLVSTYVPGAKAAQKRAEVEAEAKKYIFASAPRKYHDSIVPTFPLGCKRRIFDPGYLDSLHRENVEMVQQGIKSFDETGITGDDDVHTDFDLIVLATGFKVQQFLTPMEVVGKDGKSLNAQWDSLRGPQAYFGTMVHNFPNFAILFGPNTFPAHNSALFTCEVQVQYAARALVAPIIDCRAKIIEVKQSAEQRYVNNIHQQLDGAVFAAGCTNWYMNEFGRNVASWPGLASTFWRAAYFPRFQDYNLAGSSPVWMLFYLGRLMKQVRATSWISLAFIAIVAPSLLRLLPNRVFRSLQVG